MVWRSVRIALEPREPSFHSRLFLTETQSYIDRGRHLEKPRKRLREEGRERGEGEKGRGGERMKYFLYFFLPSPSSILYPSTSPLISVFDSSQLSGSINVQDGGKTSFLKKKESWIALQNTPALQATQAARASHAHAHGRPVLLSVFSLAHDPSFDCSRVREYAKIRIVLQPKNSQFKLWLRVW